MCENPKVYTRMLILGGSNHGKDDFVIILFLIVKCYYYYEMYFAVLNNTWNRVYKSKIIYINK